MHIVVFAHSFVSDWNHGNAHFLRGVVTELVARRHTVRCYEPREAWSVVNLLRDHGGGPLEAARRAYPAIEVRRYDPANIDLDEALDGAELAIVHEWNDPALVAAIGNKRRTRAKLRLLFHDTHHRSVTAPHEMSRYDLSHYDGVLAFGEAVSEVYRLRDWAARVWTWHEAADTRVFTPMGRRTLSAALSQRDLVWIGNWGDDERTNELREFLIEPIRTLGLDAEVYGVRYPQMARRELANADISYRGWIANYDVPRIFAHFNVTVHVPRSPYVRRLPGIPTIRVFEALACGIPLVSAPWNDCEGLFRIGTDFVMAANGDAMTRALRAVLSDVDMSTAIADAGRKTILNKHTCAHRVDELLGIYDGLVQALKPQTRASESYEEAL